MSVVTSYLVDCNCSYCKGGCEQCRETFDGEDGVGAIPDTLFATFFNNYWNAGASAGAYPGANYVLNPPKPWLDCITVGTQYQWHLDNWSGGGIFYDGHVSIPAPPNYDWTVVGPDVTGFGTRYYFGVLDPLTIELDWNPTYVVREGFSQVRTGCWIYQSLCSGPSGESWYEFVVKIYCVNKDWGGSIGTVRSFKMVVQWWDPADYDVGDNGDPIAVPLGEIISLSHNGSSGSVDTSGTTGEAAAFYSYTEGCNPPLIVFGNVLDGSTPTEIIPTANWLYDGNGGSGGGGYTQPWAATGASFAGSPPDQTRSGNYMDFTAMGLGVIKYGDPAALSVLVTA